MSNVSLPTSILNIDNPQTIHNNPIVEGNVKKDNFLFHSLGEELIKIDVNKFLNERHIVICNQNTKQVLSDFLKIAGEMFASKLDIYITEKKEVQTLTKLNIPSNFSILHTTLNSENENHFLIVPDHLLSKITNQTYHINYDMLEGFSESKILHDIIEFDNKHNSVLGDQFIFSIAKKKIYENIKIILNTHNSIVSFQQQYDKCKTLILENQHLLAKEKIDELNFLNDFIKVYISGLLELKIQLYLLDQHEIEITDEPIEIFFYGDLEGYEDEHNAKKQSLVDAIKKLQNQEFWVCNSKAQTLSDMLNSIVNSAKTVKNSLNNKEFTADIILQKMINEDLFTETNVTNITKSFGSLSNFLLNTQLKFGKEPIQANDKIEYLAMATLQAISTIPEHSQNEFTESQSLLDAKAIREYSENEASIHYSSISSSKTVFENANNCLVAINKSSSAAELTQALQTAQENGYLLYRLIFGCKEFEYLNSELSPPRPASLVHGSMRLVCSGKKILPGEDIHIFLIFNTKTLYSFKRDIWSSEEFDPDNLISKCHPDRQSLLNKLIELEARKCNLYKPWTSGHLNPDGTYSLQKLKDHSDPRVPKHSELIMDSYTKNDIVAYVVRTTDDREMSTIFQEKINYENNLRLGKKLPLVIYDESTGGFEVFIEKNINSVLEQIINNEKKLPFISKLLNIDNNTLNESIKLLPFTNQFNILSRINFDDLINLMHHPAQNIYSLRDQLYSFITKVDETANVELLRELISYGANINQIFLHGGKFSFVADILLSLEIDRTTKQKNLDNIFFQRLELFTELLTCGGTFLGEALNSRFFNSKAYPYFLNVCVDFGIPLNNIECSYLLISANDQDAEFGNIIALNQKMQAKTFDEIQHELLSFFELPEKMIKTSSQYEAGLLILFAYGANPNLIKNQIFKTVFFRQGDSFYKKAFDDEISQNTIIDKIIDLWANRENEPLYINWFEKVCKATQNMHSERQFLGISDAKLAESQEKYTYYQSKINTDFLITEFNQPPYLNDVRDINQTMNTLLVHYYKRYFIDKIHDSIKAKSSYTLWQPPHYLVKTLRCYNTVSWFSELLQIFKLLSLTAEEINLIKLATLYFDLTYGDCEKQKNNIQAAIHFKRDLKDNFSHELLDKITSVMLDNKDDPQNEKGYVYRNILLFAQLLDARCCMGATDNIYNNNNSVNTCFQNIIHGLAKYLDKTSIVTSDLFVSSLVAAIDFSIDIIEVTGNNISDYRNKGCYFSRNDLLKSGYSDNIQALFRQQDNSIKLFYNILADMSRRAIAHEVGIYTCYTQNHERCNPDIFEGITHGIHSSMELSQVNLPSEMSHLEQALYKDKPEFIREEIMLEILQEQQRLISEGIKIQGTLTQATLASDKGRASLYKRGIIVDKEEHHIVDKESRDKKITRLVAKQVRP